MRRTTVLALTLSLALPSLLSAQGLPQLKATAEAAVKAAAAAPGDYAANWQAAQACRKYGDEMVSSEAADWKNLAKAAARDGMKYGEIATRLNAKGIEGWYWHGLNVGTYSDCVSIVSALTEGLKGKTQKSFETAYGIDKMYDNGGPMLSLGRFWQVLPGIAGKDLKKAEQLFGEYVSLVGTSPQANKDAWYFRGSLYKEIGKTAEARADLQKAASMGKKEAQKLLSELK